MEMSSGKKAAYAAVFAALATVSIYMAAFLPIMLSLLAVAAAAYFVCAKIAGVLYAIMAAAVATLLTLLFTGFSLASLLNAFIFAPYAFLAFVLRGFNYKNTRGALIRGGAAACLFAAGFALLLVFFKALLLGQFDMLKGADAVFMAGAFAAVAVGAVVSDYLFIWITNTVLARIGFKNELHKS